MPAHAPRRPAATSFRSLAQASPALRAPAAAALLLLAAPVAAWAQQAPAVPATPEAWQQCRTLADGVQRLACYDRWSGGSVPADTSVATPTVPAPLASSTPGALTTPSTATTAQAPIQADVPATRVVEVSGEPGCKNPQYSDLSRFWELENDTDCGTFGIRGYRPISLSYIASDTVNRSPQSPSSSNQSATVMDYGTNEMRIQLSVRTKIGQGFLTQGDPSRRDSLWFGYTQQSYWQLFNPGLSRPFRSTDHEPELIYVYPFDLRLGDGLRLRYGSIGLSHQSNGQSLPLSRSWNRVYAGFGLESGNTWRVQARVWHRLKEEAAKDDNPDIVDFIGRGEINAAWNINAANTVSATLRHALKNDGKGSVRFEWQRAIGNEGDRRTSGLRFHTQLFTGYGDSLLDYNRRRNVLSVGLSLVDF
ncbi:MAG: phospholipase A [Burkholderiales bacterium]|nr:phospholipase A [Burkholderiales bacterium]